MTAVHARGQSGTGRAYCGRKAATDHSTNRTTDVTCADCLAALAADGYRPPSSRRR